MATTEIKRKPRKTEDCEFCNGRHFSEQARLRCMKAAEKSKCECKRYWRARFLSHQIECPLNGSFRDAVEPYTEAELAERAARSKTTNVRRKVNA